MTVRVHMETSRLDEVLKNLEQLARMSVTVGLQGQEGIRIHPGADVSVATIAMYNEFGTIDSPARSFIRTMIRTRSRSIATLWARELKPVAEGRSRPVPALSRIGASMADMMRDQIETASAWAAPNAPATVEKKGHARPLLGGDPATNLPPGSMRDAITWQVRRGTRVLAEGK